MNRVGFIIVGSLALLAGVYDNCTSQEPPGQTNDSLAIRFLLNNERVAKELELVPTQIDRLKSILDSMQHDMEEYAKSVNPFKDPGGIPAKQQAFLARSGHLAEQLKSELLPHQWKRLNQILFSFKAVREDSAAGHLILTDTLENSLQLTQSQKSEISKLVAAHRQDLDREIAEMQVKILKLKEKQHLEILNKLTRDQQEQLDELCGFPFDFLRPTSIGR